MFGEFAANNHQLQVERKKKVFCRSKNARFFYCMHKTLTSPDAVQLTTNFIFLVPYSCLVCFPTFAVPLSLLSSPNHTRAHAHFCDCHLFPEPRPAEYTLPWRLHRHDTGVVAIPRLYTLRNKVVFSAVQANFYSVTLPKDLLLQQDWLKLAKVRLFGTDNLCPQKGGVLRL